MAEQRFHQILEKTIQSGGSWASKYLKKGKIPLKLALEDAKNRGYKQELIDSVERKGILNGDLELTYEGAQNIYNHLRKIASNSGDQKKYDLTNIVDKLDPIADHETIANLLFCLHPDIRKEVGTIEKLYQTVLNLGAGRKSKHSTSEKNYTPEKKKDHIMSNMLEDIVKNLPALEVDRESEEYRRLCVILDKKAEKEAFPIFKDSPKDAFKLLDKNIHESESNELRVAYQRLKSKYQSYMNFNAHGANENFKDPNTGQVGTLPSLHQKIALYHLQNEERFGVFDGCGTGKTAIATLAQPLIEEEYKKQNKEFKRTVVICPNTAKDEWQKDLKRLMQGRTSIIIAHRLSTIMKADKIIVMDKGKIVQVGKHSKLIKQKGLYKKLWGLQRGGYIE